MPRFFVKSEQVAEGIVTILGDDAHHISRSLRMAAGEKITVCDPAGGEYECVLTDFLPDRVLARVEREGHNATEPPFYACVYQALPKGEKLDAVIQKAVECGASAVVTFESERCIAKAKDGNEDKKVERRQRIALEAAKQCGRGVIPEIGATLPFAAAVSRAASADLPLFCYEGEGTEALPTVLRRFAAGADRSSVPTVSVVVGSEGGFSEKEAEAAQKAGMIPVGLGKRILRTETAAAFVLACLVYELELSPRDLS